ncbi:MAG: hypothetical protein RMM16_02610 [Chloroherpetonaceae bacterium]|nr:hypothetical protein [Chloroherpetonaceae bacterium]
MTGEIYSKRRAVFARRGARFRLSPMRLDAKRQPTTIGHFS